MYPQLFKIPFTDLTVKSYGFMMVLGVLAAIYLIRRLSRSMGHNPEHITNAALYALLGGLFGARLFYVVHYWDNFKSNLIEIFFVWQGGLELLGGFISALAVIILYIRIHRLPVRQYLDILAMGLTVALAFGRIGCLLNGCCFGAPCDNFTAIRFPYGSIPYQNQLQADPKRNRDMPYLELTDDFFEFGTDKAGNWRKFLKPYKDLTDNQKEYLTNNDKYYCKPIWATQLISSLGGLVLTGVLYLFWRRNKLGRLGKRRFYFYNKAGTVFAMMFMLYAPMRFAVEFIRDDNPYEISTLTISQLIAMGLFGFGLILFIVFSALPCAEKPKK